MIAIAHDCNLVRNLAPGLLESAVDAQGEVASLKDNINQMIANLRETTLKNSEQDWLKTNLAKFSRMMQGQKDLESVSRLIMSELTPLVSAHHGAFFMQEGDASAPMLKLIASYAYRARKNVSNRFGIGEGLVGRGVDHPGHDVPGARRPGRQVDPLRQDPVAGLLDRMDGRSGGPIPHGRLHGSSPVIGTIAPVGQTSRQARQSVQSRSTTAGRFGAGTNARSGQVARQSPHAVQRASISTCGAVMAGTRAA